MENYTTSKPEWAPSGAGQEFACQVMSGVEQIGQPRASVVAPTVRKKYTPDEYAAGILAGNRMLLAQAITLIESNAPKHFAIGQEILQRILPHTGNAVRVGITGVPGAGKSTFIEALGNHLCHIGKKVAVLAVDPSSTVSRGSILGDKTRMETLSRQSTAFIRPSPSSGTLGGVNRKSRETMLLCEAAGFDTILVETVGVGQSEISVRSMVDFFLVVVLTGAGDDLQGIKKGIIETADAILVNKADGANKHRAQATRAEYEQILHFLRPNIEGWTPKAYVCSALNNEGISEIWDVVMDFMSTMTSRGTLQCRRQQQTLDWVWQMTEEQIRSEIQSNPAVQTQMAALEGEIIGNRLSATQAAQALLGTIHTAMRG